MNRPINPNRVTSLPRQKGFDALVLSQTPGSEIVFDVEALIARGWRLLSKTFVGGRTTLIFRREVK